MWIPFAPVPKGRPRFGKGRAYTPLKTKNYEQMIRDFVAAHHVIKQPLSGPLGITMVFFLKNKYVRYHDIKPDLDNLAKAVLDSLGPKTYNYIGLKTLTRGILYDDDAQVAHLDLFKICHPKQGIWLRWETLSAKPEIIHPLERV
jgi:Holliday junction resolvase RusA-like endonuclease